MPLKNADQIIGPALDKFYELRPGSFKHINGREGVYWHPWAAQRAQVARVLKRLAALVASNRLTAEGQELLDYASSEYEAIPSYSTSFAEGEISFSRPAGLVSGDIPKGTRFVRQAQLTTQIPVAEATYETLANTHFGIGQTGAGGVPIRAVSVGPGSNHPLRTDTVDFSIQTSGLVLFDPTIEVSAFSAAGGSDLPEDVYVRRFSKAYAKGHFGPDKFAALYGALRHPGVRKVLEYTDGAAGCQKVLVADGSWASSDQFARSVQQTIYDAKLVGFGCRVQVVPVRNIVVSVEANVTLRDWNFTDDTLGIDEAIRAAVRSYLDDRPDWNVWKEKALRAAITRAHPKVLNCTDVVMRDVTSTTVPQISSVDYNVEQFHYYLASNAVQATYSGPT